MHYKFFLTLSLGCVLYLLQRLLIRFYVHLLLNQENKMSESKDKELTKEFPATSPQLDPILLARLKVFKNCIFKF